MGLSRARVGALGVLAAACILLPAAGLDHASAQSPTIRVDIASVTEMPYPDARAVLNLEDTSGTPLDALNATNFTATVNGKPATVKSALLASSEKLGVDVLLMIDTSGSMKDGGLAAAQQAAKEFVNNLAPEDRVAVMRFANSVTLQSDYTTDRSATYSAIDGLVAKGQTELYKATSAAAAKTRESQSSRRVVILLTDGAQDAIVTDVTSGDAVNAAIDSGVPFYTIAQGSQAAGAQFLIDLGSRTRGRYLEAPSLADVGGVYAGIGRLLRNQYVVTFDASAAAGSVAGTAVTIQLNSGGRGATGTANFKPTPAFAAPKIQLTVSGLTEGESLTEARAVTVVGDGSQPVTKASFYVDDVNVFETSTPPLTYNFDPKAFKGGAHTLRVSVLAGTQTVDSAKLGFVSTPPAAATDGGNASDGGGGAGLPLVPIAGGVGGVIALGVVALVVVGRRRPGGGPMLAPAEQRITPWATTHRSISAVPPAAIMPVSEPEAEDIGEPLGLLVVRAGNLFGSEFEVGPKPAIIGSGASCAVRIDDAAQEEARVWVRDGHLMFHKKTRLTLIASDGISGGWTIFEPGDTFDIGEHRFEFRLLPQGLSTGEPRPAASNVLRDVNPPPRAAGPTAMPAPWRTADSPASQLGRLWPLADEAAEPHAEGDLADEQAG